MEKVYQPEDMTMVFYLSAENGDTYLCFVVGSLEGLDYDYRGYNII